LGGAVVGCCGWAYQDWRGPFYPADAGPGDLLPAYARSFAAVEVDSTFYGPPSESTVRQWDERTPAHFRFALKVPRAVTHEKRLRDAEPDFEEFVRTTALLGRKRGPLLLQFPRFARTDFDDAGDFLEILDRFLSRAERGLKIAVEVRNPRWFDDPLLDLLRDHGAAAVLTDQGGGPPRRPDSLRSITADFTYVRLLGDRHRIETVTKTWGATVLDRAEKIGGWAAFVRGLCERAPDLGIWVFANNHFSGHAPDAARRLASLLEAPP
jgi:uncharacterized protein YecE (DUF72 family)